MVSSASMCQTQNETDLQSCVQSQHQAMYYCCLCLLSKQNIDCIGEVGYPSIFTSPHSIDGFYYIPCTICTVYILVLIAKPIY